MCQRSGLSELVSPVAETQTSILSPLHRASACGHSHCCPACSSAITGGRRSTEITLNIAKCTVGHLNMDTEECHQNNSVAGKVLGPLGQSLCEPGAAFLAPMLLSARLLQGRACFNSMCGSKQNAKQVLISAWACRHCSLKAVLVAGYQVLIPANHGQGYPRFLAFTGKPVCSL